MDNQSPMTEPTQKKLSRRDALKLLGAAAGAAALANLPSKWSKPELAGGVLPAHAATSCVGTAVSYTITANTSPFSYTIYLNGNISQSGALNPGQTLSNSLACQTGCWEIFAYGNGSIALTTFSQNKTTFSFVIAQRLLVDLGTGAYSSDGTTSPSGSSCQWVPT